MTTNLKFRLRPKQRLFVQSKQPFSMYVGGVGAGKTYAGVIRAIMYMLLHPNSLGMIAAPTYRMLKDATQRTFFELLPKELIRDFNKNDQQLTLINGAECLFRSTDNPESTRGPSYAWCWLDEAPLCGHYVWSLLKARMRQSGFNVAMWATGTPLGKDGYWRDFENPTTCLPGHELFRASTMDNAVNLPAGYVESLNYEGEFYAQEVLGLFTAFEGLVYANFEPDPRVLGANVRSVPAGKTFRQMIGGVDWGYTNPATALVFGLDGDDRAWQTDELYATHLDLHRDLIPEIVRLTRLHHVTEWWCDSAEPGNIKALNDALDSGMIDCSAYGADKSIIEGISTVRTLTAQRADGTRGLYVDPRCVHTIEEYGSYQFPTREAKHRNDTELPVDKKNHAMDAGRYALHNTIGKRRERGIAFARSRSTMTDTERLLLHALEAEEPDDDETDARNVRNSARSARFLRDLGTK